MAQTTEERIAEIANRFAQGLNIYNQGQQQANTLLAQEAQRRQQALAAQNKMEMAKQKNDQDLNAQAVKVQGDIKETTGRFVPITAAKNYISTGDGSLLQKEIDAAPVDENWKLDQDVKRSQINKNNRSSTGVKPTVGEQSVDRNFSKTYDEFIVGGGYTKVDKGLKTLQQVAQQLGDDSSLTGAAGGRLPDLVRSFTNPEAIIARDKVGTIIQDNLKQILGSSYTEAEGERVIKRSYDPTLPASANKEKLEGSIKQMAAAAKAKLEAAKYFEQNGTLKGYKGTVINSVDDIFNSQTDAAPPSSSPWKKYGGK
jgi:hypothetical protein